MINVNQKYHEIIEKAWKDEEFKNRLISHPHEALKEVNVEIPKSIEINVVEEKENMVYVVIPVKPDEKWGRCDEW